MATKTKVKVKVTLGFFDEPGGWGSQSEDRFRLKRDGVALGKFEKLTLDDYSPRGGTPLLDATAWMIQSLDKRQKDGRVEVGILLDESGSMGSLRDAVVDGINEFVNGLQAVDAVDEKAAGKVMCLIFTDGHENQSREYTREQIAKMVKEREERGWTFIFMGANQDAWAEGHKFGIAGRATTQSVNFTASDAGVRSSLRSATGHAQHYLGDQDSYAVAASMTALRTVTEDGTEVPKPKTRAKTK